MMTFEQWEEMVVDYLDQKLSREEREAFERALKANPEWEKELKDAAGMLEKLDILNESEIPQKLQDDLKNLIETGERQRVIPGGKNDFFPWGRYARYAFAAGLILFGFILGKLGNIGNGNSTDQLHTLQDEVQQMRQMVSMSMLKQQSPSARLQGIRFTARVEKPDDELIYTIIRLLKTDPNVNVRLASVEALYLFRDFPAVKEQLIEALRTERSPLVQVAIIDLLIDIKENRAIEALKQLINNKEINEAVRQRAEIGIQKLS